MSYFSDNYENIRYPIAVPSENIPGLRKAQLGAIHALASHFTLHNQPAIVIMPTGAGKTAVLMMAAYVLRAKRVLVITPSRLVRNQIVEDFQNLNVLKKIRVLSNDTPAPNINEVYKTVSEVAVWNEYYNFDVVVSTPKSISPALEKIVTPPEDLFDLILVDEAHHSAAKTWEEILNCFPEAKKLLFTATPFRQDRKEIKGKFVYTYSLSEAYNDEIYGNIEYIPVKSNNNYSNDIAIAKETERVYNIDKAASLEHFVMVRTETIPRAKELELIYKENTSLNLQRVDSKHSYGHVKKIIQKLRNKELDGIICVDMLGEGFDFPNLKIAAIHVPHRSLAVTLQFIGRFARTNAPKLGTAKFLAVPSEIQIETEKLYQEGAVWQKIIANLSESKLEHEIDIKEQLEKFDDPIIKDIEIDDLSLYALTPYNHVKIYRTDICNLDEEITINYLPVVYRQQSKPLNCLVFITKEVQKPGWTNVDIFEKIVYDLFVVYYDTKAKLLFICASRRTEPVFDQIAVCLTDGGYSILPLNILNKVLLNLKNPEFFNVGLRNRVSMSNTESYRIIAGSNAHKAVKESDGRLFHSGHLFGRGVDNTGNACTIGFSSLSKVWSNSSSQIPQLIKWCKEIAIKTTSKAEVVTNSALDYLSVGEEAKEIPLGVVSVCLDKDAFINPMMLKYKLDDGIERTIQLLDVDINVDTINSNKDVIYISVIHDDFDYQLEYVLNQKPHLKALNNEFKIFIARNNPYGGEYRVPLIEYLNSRPLSFFFADGSMLDGVNLFRKNKSILNLFNRQQLIPFDWDSYKIDIKIEFGELQNNKISIQDGLIEYFKKQNYKLVFCDHGTGEIADFIAIKSDGIIKIDFYHCKSSDKSKPGNRVNDVYEVCGQAVKSVQWIERNEALLKQLKSRSMQKLNHKIYGNRYIIGDEKEIDALLDEINHKLCFYEIYIVQPGITKNKIEEKILEVLSSTNDYVAGANCDRLKIFCNE